MGKPVMGVGFKLGHWYRYTSDKWFFEWNGMTKATSLMSFVFDHKPWLCDAIEGSAKYNAGFKGMPHHNSITTWNWSSGIEYWEEVTGRMCPHCKKEVEPDMLGLCPECTYLIIGKKESIFGKIKRWVYER